MEDKKVSARAIARLVGNYGWALVMTVIGSFFGGVLSVALAVFVYGVLSHGDTTPMVLAFSAGGPAMLGIDGYSDSAASAIFSAARYFTFVGIWVTVLVYLRLSRASRPILKTVTPFTRGNTLGRLGLGLLVGFVLNGVCAAVAVATGSINLSYIGLNVGGIALLAVTVFVQSSAEELICRCYLYQKTLRATGSPWVAIAASSLVFGALHLANSGVTALSFVNVILVGVLFALMVWRLDSPWMAFAAHASWNFTQNVLLGLPNSGSTIPFAVFGIAPGSTPSAGLAYSPSFGIEGSIMATLVLIAGCGLVWYWGKRRGVTPTDVWEADSEPVAAEPKNL